MLPMSLRLDLCQIQILECDLPGLILSVSFNTFSITSPNYKSLLLRSFADWGTDLVNGVFSGAGQTGAFSRVVDRAKVAMIQPPMTRCDATRFTLFIQILSLLISCLTSCIGKSGITNL